MIGHIAGIPIEESILQLAPAGAAAMTAFAIGWRAVLRRLRRRPGAPLEARPSFTSNPSSGDER